MLMPDVNLLVNAFRSDATRHAEYRQWLHELRAGPEPFGLSDAVLAGFVRVVTHPRAFARPDPVRAALDFAAALRRSENCVPIVPGPRHWPIFASLCQQAQARGNLVADAYLAALAIESGCTWITDDGDFARFPGLSWRRPLAGS